MPVVSSNKGSILNITIRKAIESDSIAMANIFNYFVKNSFAAFPTEGMDEASFFKDMKRISFTDSVYAAECKGKIVGFGIIKRFYLSSVFNMTGEVGYFMLPEFTGKGAGAKLLDRMEKDARAIGIQTLLASVSSLNPRSVDFHKKHGFAECACFKKVGLKKGENFDIIWMQKFL